MNSAEEMLKSTILAAFSAYFRREWMLTAFAFIASVVGLVASIMSFTNVDVGPRSLTLVLVAVGVLVGAALFRFMVWSKPIRESVLMEKAKAFHTIAHTLRDGMIQMARRPAEPQRIIVEKSVLDNIVKQIAELFSEVTGVPCRAKVSLVVQADPSGKTQVFTWATSDTFADIAKVFSTTTLENNTHWTEALKDSPTGHRVFFADDLLKLERAGEYKNDTPGWQNQYRSIIVVPITVGGEKEKEVLGFLSVESPVPYRLNDRSQGVLLAAFADQIASFTLMSRRPLQLGSAQQKIQV